MSILLFQTSCLLLFYLNCNIKLSISCVRTRETKEDYSLGEESIEGRHSYIIGGGRPKKSPEGSDNYPEGYEENPKGLGENPN